MPSSNPPQHNRGTADSSNHPPNPDVQRALRIAEDESRRLARSHYENFLVASVLLPRRLRQPFYNVYAFCRTADDLADESSSPDEALRQLDHFQRQLDESFAGNARENLFIALMNTAQQFELPKQPFDDLLNAFRQDQRKQRYENFAELVEYCRRSANPVGRIVLQLVSCDVPGHGFGEQAAQLSDQICTGLQLANFWQDVARDHAMGRIYLPQDAMQRHGVSAAMLGESSTPQPLRKLLRSECDRAEDFLQRGLPLADQVPRWFASDVRLFAHGGLATLEAIRRIDYDVLKQRPTIGKPQQAWMVAKAALGLL